MHSRNITSQLLCGTKISVGGEGPMTGIGPIDQMVAGMSVWFTHRTTIFLSIRSCTLLWLLRRWISWGMTPGDLKSHNLLGSY